MIIGSTAIKYYFPEFPRDPKDFDILKDSIYPKVWDTTKRIEVLKNPVLLKYYNNRYPEYIGLNELYTLKVSHSFWDLENHSWKKHMWDIQWLKEKGCQLIESLFYDLFDLWSEKHGKRKTSDLTKTSEDFFDNAIKYRIPHDTLHEILIQHPYFIDKTPTYKKILISEVDVSMEKFKQLSNIDKFNVVFEEIAVMAFEPRFNSTLHWKHKYELMLKKFILNHCKIEEGIWIIENHKRLLSNIPFNYEEFLTKKINDGIK